MVTVGRQRSMLECSFNNRNNRASPSHSFVKRIVQSTTLSASWKGLRRHAISVLCKKLELFSQQLSLKNNGPSSMTLCIVLSWKPYLGPQCLFLNFTTNLDFTRTFWPRQCYVCFADFYFFYKNNWKTILVHYFYAVFEQASERCRDHCPSEGQKVKRGWKQD